MAFTITEIEGCTIVEGILPIMEMVALAEKAGDGALMDPGLAKIYGATMVIGLPAALEALKKSPQTTERAKEKAVSEAGSVNLSDKARHWLEAGERGLSSEAMFTRFTGTLLADSLAAPRDGDDFRRCRLLLEGVPEFNDKLYLMKDVSPQWHSLVSYWDELCGLMDDEAPNWRQREGTSRNLNEKMREFLA